VISLFTWNDNFLTHLPSIDGQHQRLVGLVNDLAELVIAADGINPQTYAALRAAVLDYASVHFQDEEELMVASGLDVRHLELHLEQHRSFLEEAMNLGEPGETVDPERDEKLVEFLVRWLAYHILGTDQSMARQVRWIHAGDSPAQAFVKDVQKQSSSTDPLLSAMTGLFFVVSERNRELRALNNVLEQRVQERTLELEKANHQLQLLATQDELTGLPNRRFASL
jgi:hemerythrin-like metal-binding protein